MWSFKKPHSAYVSPPAVSSASPSFRKMQQLVLQPTFFSITQIFCPNDQLQQQ